MEPFRQRLGDQVVVKSEEKYGSKPATSALEKRHVNGHSSLFVKVSSSFSTSWWPIMWHPSTISRKFGTREHKSRRVRETKTRISLRWENLSNQQGFYFNIRPPTIGDLRLGQVGNAQQPHVYIAGTNTTPIYGASTSDIIAMIDTTSVGELERMRVPEKYPLHRPNFVLVNCTWAR